jgi:hypothetical protein
MVTDGAPLAMRSVDPFDAVKHWAAASRLAVVAAVLVESTSALVRHAPQ